MMVMLGWGKGLLLLLLLLLLELMLMLMLMLLLVDVLLRLSMMAMRGKLYWNILSSICDVCQSSESLEIQLQVVVRTTPLPAGRGILDVCL
jgi:hypothetical protein